MNFEEQVFPLLSSNHWGVAYTTHMQWCSAECLVVTYGTIKVQSSK